MPAAPRRRERLPFIPNPTPLSVPASMIRSLLLLTTAALAVIAVPARAQFGAPPTQAPNEPLPESKPLEMPGRGIKGASFAGLAPEEAREAQQILEQAIAADEAGRKSQAFKLYRRCYRKFPRSAAAPEAYYRSAKILLEKGDLLKAFEAFDVVVRAYPNFGRFNELIAEEYKIAFDLVNGKRLKLFGVLPGFSNTDRGIYYFERIIYNAPYSDFAPLALLNIAETHIREGRPDAAIDALDRLITNYPASVATPDGYLRLAQVHEKLVDGPLYDQGETKEAITHYEDFLILFPENPDVGTAEEGLARMKDILAQSRIKIGDFYYLKRKRYQAARVFYNEAITIAPNSPSARLARERLAKLEVDEARYEAEVAERQQKGSGGFLGLFRRKPINVDISPLPEPPADQKEQEEEELEGSRVEATGDAVPANDAQP
ncbi:MAG: outer membrane protein assembly factor BamD [Verrucomicrobia bacterium]|nr:MAG: outer membrane protein assembly factor BamD [Verrucomicrobiota bacterium]